MTELFWRDKPGGDVEVDDRQGKDRGREVKVMRTCLYPFREPFPAQPQKCIHHPAPHPPFLSPSFSASASRTHFRSSIIFKKLVKARSLRERRNKDQYETRPSLAERHLLRDWWGMRQSDQSCSSSSLFCKPAELESEHHRSLAAQSQANSLLALIFPLCKWR